MTATGLALIADIHGNSWALDAVLADIDRRGVREIINLGGSPHARYAILCRSDVGWGADLIAVPYAWGGGARSARRHSRPDRAAWIASGRATR